MTTMAPAATAASTTATRQALLPCIHLQPLQSVHLHGWLNPKRTLHWDDMCHNPRITLDKCLELGICNDDLRKLQPDVHLWIKHKKVSFAQVPRMVGWPLHPVRDLKGNIGDLATMHYSVRTLRQLAITYEYLRAELSMDDEWMKMLRYSPSEWSDLGFERHHVKEMGQQRVQFVFGMDTDLLLLSMAAAMHHHHHHHHHSPH